MTMFLLVLALLKPGQAAPGLADIRASDYSREAIELVTHVDVLIDSDPDVVWPHIVDPSAWKSGAIMTPVAGVTGEVGEIFAAYADEKSSEPLFFQKTVELEENVRKTIKLYSANGGPLIGHAVWEIKPVGEEVEVSYHVYCELPSPPGLSQLELEKLERQYRANDTKRFQEELLVLKALVEAPSR